MSIYSEIILDHYQNPKNFGHLEKPTHKAQGSNPVCGDQIIMEGIIQDEKLVDIRFSGTGCAISMASASMLTSFVKGKLKKDLRKINKDFIIKMIGINLGINRLKCALLPLEVFHRLLTNDRVSDLMTQKNIILGCSVT